MADTDESTGTSQQSGASTLELIIGHAAETQGPEAVVALAGDHLIGHHTMVRYYVVWFRITGHVEVAATTAAFAPRTYSMNLRVSIQPEHFNRLGEALQFIPDLARVTNWRLMPSLQP